MSDSYAQCLEAAGATVHAFESFGSYQGDWYAKVTYKNDTFWVSGSFGSCSGCDAFESEFGDITYHGKYGESGYHSSYCVEDLKEECEECDSLRARFISFGERYLDQHLSQEEAEKEASRHSDWDMEATAMLAFIKENAIER